VEDTHDQPVFGGFEDGARAALICGKCFGKVSVISLASDIFAKNYLSAPIDLWKPPLLKV